MRSRVFKAVVIAIVVLMIVGCDQATKQIARSRLQGRGTVLVVDTVLILRYVENEGAFLGLGSRLPAALRMTLLVAFPLAALAGVVVAMIRSKALPWSLLVGLSFVAGGGFGNLVDRVFRGGHVSDFINLGIGNVRTGIFNVADLAVLTGCVLLLLTSGGRRSTRDPTSS